MSKLREKLKRTKLRPIVLWFRQLPPIKAFRLYMEHRRQDKLLFDTLPAVYNSHLNEPLDENKVILVEYRLPKLSNSFEQLYEMLQAYDFDVHIHYLRNSYVKRAQFEANCEKLVHDMATAKYIFICESINVMGSFKRREGQQIVQLWHACGAFKRFGMSTADKLFGATREMHLRHPSNINYTRVTVSSPEVVWAYAEALDMKDREELIKPLGTSRTDIFFREDLKEEAFRRVYEAFPAARGKKIILFAPTYRGNVKDAKTADAFDPEVFYQAFRDEYVLIIKHHPMTRDIYIPKLAEHMKDSFAYDATKTLSIEDLLVVSDICISDYSSLIYEYSLFTRPMLFFAYDLEEYFDWRGFYYPYEELTPGPVLKTNEEMVDYIRHIDERFDPEVVKAFRERFMSACDGHATERILKDTMGEAVLEKHRKHIEG